MPTKIHFRIFVSGVKGSVSDIMFYLKLFLGNSSNVQFNLYVGPWATTAFNISWSASFSSHLMKGVSKKSSSRVQVNVTCWSHTSCKKVLALILFVAVLVEWVIWYTWPPTSTVLMPASILTGLISCDGIGGFTVFLSSWYFLSLWSVETQIFFHIHKVFISDSIHATISGWAFRCPWDIGNWKVIGSGGATGASSCSTTCADVIHVTAWTPCEGTLLSHDASHAIEAAANTLGKSFFIKIKLYPPSIYYTYRKCKLKLIVFLLENSSHLPGRASTNGSQWRDTQTASFLKPSRNVVILSARYFNLKKYKSNLNHLFPQKRDQYFGNPHRSIFILIILEDSNHCSAACKSRGIIGMNKL